MQAQRLAIIGFGRLGRACAQAILEDPQISLAGIVRRQDRVAEALPEPFTRTPRVAHVHELGGADAALVCVPAAQTLSAVKEVLQARIGAIECTVLHGAAFEEHRREIGRMARLHKAAAIVGAGWDPGALSLFRGLFALLCPKGHTQLTRHPGAQLHHTALAGVVPGVKAALATEAHDGDGRAQRYVYVELERGADVAQVERGVRGDPLYAGEETFVFPVEQIAALEGEGGVVLERRESAIPGAQHVQLLLEARFSEPVLSARVMVAAARVLSQCEHRAYSLFELPPGALWGSLQHEIEREWA